LQRDDFAIEVDNGVLPVSSKKEEKMRRTIKKENIPEESLSTMPLAGPLRFLKQWMQIR